jgi:thymidylate kinase
MKLIVEGPDLSGKSTAIEKIGKFYNMGFTLKNNFKPRNKQNSSEIYAHYWEIINLLSNQPFVILDRFFPSQAVYSYMRGVDELYYAEIFALDNHCSETDYIYIYLDTTLADLEKRYKDRGDEHIAISDLRKIKRRYNTFFRNTLMTKYKLRTTEKDWFEKLQI